MDAVLTFCLIRESSDGYVPPPPIDPTRQSNDLISLPPGIYIYGGSDDAPLVRKNQLEETESGFILEVLDSDPRRVHIIDAFDLGYRLNGQPAPPISTIKSGDQLDLGNDAVLYATWLERPFVGEADARHADCTLCRTPAEGHRVFVCPTCGSTFHDDAPDSKDSLECLKLASECPSCESPLDPSPRFTFWPGF